MEQAKRKDHWEKIYQHKRMKEVSWYQEVPQTSLDIVEELKVPPTARVIDVGAGDSFLSDFLIRAGFVNISALDISVNAVERARSRLGVRSHHVQYLVSDITDFEPSEPYDLWHDRAVLHFLTTDEEVSKYVASVQKSVVAGGHVIIGVFSDAGPKKCSGIDVRQYNEASMRVLLGEDFEVLRVFREDHSTPFDTTQNFIFGVFRKIG